MDQSLVAKVGTATKRFCDWLEGFGELSYDHQVFASKVGHGAKALYYPAACSVRCGRANDFFRSIRSVDAHTVLEAATVSYRGCTTQWALRFSRRPMSRMSIIAGGSLPRSVAGNQMSTATRTMAGDIRSIGKRETAPCSRTLR
jgi:hypothetical protein